MSLAFVDFFAYVLFGLKYLAITLALLMFILGLDDLFIDLVYWTRKLIRRWRIYEKFRRADEERLYSIGEKPLAIMVPAWNEVGVVGEMARLAASTIDYENYQIFVGTYPNDAETQAGLPHAPAVGPPAPHVPSPAPTTSVTRTTNPSVLRLREIIPVPPRARRPAARAAGHPPASLSVSARRRPPPAPACGW